MNGKKNYYNLISLCRKDPFFFKISIKDNFAMIEKDKNKLIEICKVLNIHNYTIREGIFQVFN